MARFPSGFSLHVKRPGTPGRFGAKTAGSEHDVPDCAAAPAGSVETVAGQNTVLEQDTVYGPYDADVQSQDTVVIPAGQAVPAGEYEVDGTVQRWKSPFTGREFGSVIRLTRPDAASDS